MSGLTLMLALSDPRLRKVDLVQHDDAVGVAVHRLTWREPAFEHWHGDTPVKKPFEGAEHVVLLLRTRQPDGTWSLVEVYGADQSPEDAAAAAADGYVNLVQYRRDVAMASTRNGNGEPVTETPAELDYEALRQTITETISEDIRPGVLEQLSSQELAEIVAWIEGPATEEATEAQYAALSRMSELNRAAAPQSEG